mgnify:CR=1 FL=1
MSSILKVDSIQNAAGTAAMTINSSGIVSSTAVLSVMYNSSSVTILDNSDTVIPLQTSAVDTHNLYDATNDRLLITSAFNGSYFIISWSVMVTASDGDNMQCHLSKNGTAIQTDRKFYNGGEGESISMHGVWMGQVSTNDYFSLIGFCDKASGTSTSVAGLNNTFLYAAKLF